LLPLVLDDVLVNFDARRAEAAAEVLRDFANSGHQMLLFTCHQHIMGLFRAADVEVRALPGHDGTGQPELLLGGSVVEEVEVLEPELDAEPGDGAEDEVEEAEEEALEVVEPAGEELTDEMIDESDAEQYKPAFEVDDQELSLDDEQLGDSKEHRTTDARLARTRWWETDLDDAAA
jgi:hypothetical protein